MVVGHLVHRTKIVIPDSMKQSLNFGKSVSDASFGEFRRQLEYKAPLAGCHIITADKWYASSKLCSNCGCKNDHVVLGVQTWTCQNCHVTHDRDTNAAINLRKLALEYRERINACGDDVTPATALDVIKQELLHESAA